MHEVVPELAAHFGERITGIQAPQFLIYRRGDFFRPHTDNSGDPRQPADVRKRRISAILFLNPYDPTGTARESFAGGELLLYRLGEHPTWQDYCTPLIPEEGLLIAFPSNIEHEVMPVTRGVRFTAVLWLVA